MPMITPTTISRMPLDVLLTWNTRGRLHVARIDAACTAISPPVERSSFPSKGMAPICRRGKGCRSRKRENSRGESSPAFLCRTMMHLSAYLLYCCREPRRRVSEIHVQWT